MKVLLSCYHTPEFSHAAPPSAGDTVYCRNCYDYRKVLSKPDNIRYRCTVCKKSRYFGADQLEALKSGGRHVERYPTHVVRVTRNGTLLKELRNSSVPLPKTVLQWTESHPDHQGALKGLKASIRTKADNTPQGA